MDLAVAADLRLEPVGERVDALRADPVQTAGIFVRALAEFAAGVQIGQDQLDGGNAELFVDIDRDAAAVVPHRAGAVEVDGDVDVVAVAREMFVDGIVEHLEDAVVQPAFIGIADVHARALAHRFQALEFVDLLRTIGLAGGDVGGRRIWFSGNGVESDMKSGDQSAADGGSDSRWRAGAAHARETACDGVRRAMTRLRNARPPAAGKSHAAAV